MTDNSKTDNSKTTDSHNSTTNNYYTYNNPTDNTSAGKDSASETTSPTVNTVTVGSTSGTKSANQSEPKEDTVTETKEDDEAATSVQMPDNIKLNLQYVDVVYEMVDGRSSIEISSPTEQAVNMASASQSTSDSTVFLDGAVTPMADVYNDSTNQRESSSIDWYEVIKILLLIALFIVVVPKPRWKMVSQNEIAVPEPEGNLKVQSEEETPRQEKKKKSKKHMEN
jgi:hypothetical protein